VQGHRQFDHAESGAKMSAGTGDRFDQVLADFARISKELALIELAQSMESRCGRGADSAGYRSLQERREFSRLLSIIRSFAATKTVSGASRDIFRCSAHRQRRSSCRAGAFILVAASEKMLARRGAAMGDMDTFSPVVRATNWPKRRLRCRPQFR
jgi:hypothetical protein